MATVRPYLHGERPRAAAAVALAVGVVTAALLLSVGLSDSRFGVSAVFLAGFGVLPALAGGLCGWYRLGYPGAAASGVAPGVAFYTVVALGNSFDVGTFGGGDSPLVPFTFLLVSGSFVWATAGFALAVSVALLSRRWANGSE